MKILFLSNSIGGLRNFRYELIEYLRDRGDDVYIGSNIEESPQPFEMLGCKIYETPMELRGTSIISDAKLIYSYIKLIKNVCPNVVLTYTIKPNTYGGLICRIMKCPQIASITGLGTAFEVGGIITFIAKYLYKLGLNNCSRVFFQNKESLSVFDKYKIAKKCDRSIIAGSGVNLDKFKFCAYPIDRQKIDFIFVGKTRKEKGFDHYLDAAKVLKPKYPFCNFHIVGACEEHYKSIIKSLVEDNIIVNHGYQNNVIPFIEECNCNILPSYHEGMSNSLQESSAIGRPAIATDISGCREIVVDNQTGFLVKPRSSQNLIDKIEQFINLPYEDKVAMGLNARSWVEQHFNRKYVVYKYVEAIDLVKIQTRR